MTFDRDLSPGPNAGPKNTLRDPKRRRGPGYPDRWLEASADQGPAGKFRPGSPTRGRPNIIPTAILLDAMMKSVVIALLFSAVGAFNALRRARARHSILFRSHFGLANSHFGLDERQAPHAHNRATVLSSTMMIEADDAIAEVRAYAESAESRMGDWGYDEVRSESAEAEDSDSIAVCPTWDITKEKEEIFSKTQKFADELIARRATPRLLYFISRTSLLYFATRLFSSDQMFFPLAACKTCNRATESSILHRAAKHNSGHVDHCSFFSCFSQSAR